MAWVPVDSPLVTHVATPLVRLWALQEPIFAPVSWKVTVPVGVPVPGEVTVIVAVKVTLCPTTDGLLLLVTVAVVAALLFVWVTVLLVLG